MKHQSQLVSIAMVTCLALALGGCVTAKQKKIDLGINPMSDTELKTFFSKPVDASFHSSTRNNTITLKYYPDGSQKLISPRITDEGTYTIKNGEQCSKWKVIRNGAEKCTTWFDIGDNKYETFERNGSKNGTLTVK